MKKKKTPLITIALYAAGVLFLLMALFMLVTAITYTKAYLESYDATFADMWSNSVQYVIAQFGPYMGIGIVALGLGKAIKESRRAQETGGRSGLAGRSMTYSDKADASLKEDELMREMETVREVISIKIEEKEKRDSYRLGELERKLESVIAAYAAADEESASAYEEDAAADEESAATDEESVAADEEGAAADEEDAAANEESAVAYEESAGDEETEAENIRPAGPVPQLFRMEETMAMPAIPRTEEKTGELEFDAFAKRDAKKDTFSKDELRAALAREEEFQKAKQEEMERLKAEAEKTDAQ